MKFLAFALSILLTQYQTTDADSFHQHRLMRKKLAKMSKSSKSAPKKLQPGAVYSEEGFNNTENGYPKGNITYRDLPILDGDDATTFVNGTAEPVELIPLGDDTFLEIDKYQNKTTVALSRIYDSSSSELGSFWSNKIFDQEEDFYGGLAVELQWNLGQYVVQLRTLESCLASLKVSKGKVAIQLANYFENETLAINQYDDHYILPGGETQYWIPRGNFPYINNTDTKWKQKPRGELQLISIKPLNANQIPTGCGPW